MRMIDASVQMPPSVGARVCCVCYWQRIGHPDRSGFYFLCTQVYSFASFMMDPIGHSGDELFSLMHVWSMD